MDGNKDVRTKLMKDSYITFFVSQFQSQHQKHYQIKGHFLTLSLFQKPNQTLLNNEVIWCNAMGSRGHHDLFQPLDS